MNMQTFFILFCAISASGLAADYEYVSYGASDSYNLGRESFRLDTVKKEMVSFDSIESVEVCDEESEFHCFYNLAISFFVPREAVSVGESWYGNGLTFRVLRQDKVEVFGVSKGAVVIEAKRADRTDYFFYSPDDGLLAIKHVSKNGLPTQFFVLAGDVGFPR